MSEKILNNIIEKYVFFKAVDFAKKELQLENNFSIKLSKNHSDFTTTAYFNPTDNEIAIYVKNRAIYDIIRSLFHELVHLKQKNDNKLEKNAQDIGGTIEDEANSLAGSMLKKFGYSMKEKGIDMWDIKEKENINFDGAKST